MMVQRVGTRCPTIFEYWRKKTSSFGPFFSIKKTENMLLLAFLFFPLHCKAYLDRNYGGRKYQCMQIILALDF